jgi:hypothetical protein
MNTTGRIQERIQNRHKLLDYFTIVKREGATEKEIVKDLGPWATEALEDLVALGLVKRKGGKVCGLQARRKALGANSGGGAMIEALAFLLGVPAALIAGAAWDERRKAREKRRKRMERIALRDLRVLKRELGLK